MFGLENIAQAFTPLNLLLAVGGVILGAVIGALPGLSATMAVAVLVPFTFTMNPGSGLIMLGAIYMGAIYGGAYSAILVNTPGTPSAIATTFDGYPMAKRGEAKQALTVVTFASVTGGIIGTLFLLFLAPPLARFALAFGPAEYFWMAMLGLTLIAALSTNNLLKGIVGACFGLLLSMVGVAVIGGDIRFTLGMPELVGGINIVAALIGLYCIPVLIDLVETPDPHLRFTSEGGGFQLPRVARTVWRDKFNLIRSSIIGTVVGMLPGAGGSIASLVAYAEARRASRHPEEFGKGTPSGLIASESANNGTVGGGFIPTLVLGIPGTPPDAVILGALLIQGIRTGPTLFTDEGAIVYTFIYGLLIATVLMFPCGLFLARYAYKAMIAVPKAMLVPMIAFMTVVGSYAIQNDPNDVTKMFVLGVMSWVLGRQGFTPSPIVLGIVLGQIAEQGFVQAYLVGTAQGNLLGMYFGRPISLVIIALILLALVYPVFATWLRRFTPVARTDDEATTGPHIRPTETQAAEGPDTRDGNRRNPGGALAALVFVGIGVWAMLETRAMTMLGSIFPVTIAGLMILVAAMVMAVDGLGLRPPGRSEEVTVQEGSWPRRLLFIALTGLWVVLMPRLGFVSTALTGFLGLVLIANYEKISLRFIAVYVIKALTAVSAFYILLGELLNVPIPRGVLF